MTTIRLGTGADAVDVESGLSVPLIENRNKRALVIHVENIGTLMQLAHSSVWLEIHDQTGRPSEDTWDNGIPVAIDLAALRRERAPKSATVWRCAMPAPDDSCMELQRVGTRIRSPQAQTWVHRPGAHAETWAAFDAAVGVWLRRMDKSGTARGTWCEEIEGLRDAARALGYDRP